MWGGGGIYVAPTTYRLRFEKLFIDIFAMAGYCTLPPSLSFDVTHTHMEGVLCLLFLYRWGKGRKGDPFPRDTGSFGKLKRMEG